MLYSLSGILKLKTDAFLVLEAHGMGLRVRVPASSRFSLPAEGSPLSLFISMQWKKDDGPELYGFINDSELRLFEKLTSISGIGPKSAMAIFGVGKIEQVVAAINEGKPDFLTKAPGVGRKTAERIVLELKGKLDAPRGEATLALLESDQELEETLVSLGYSKSDAKQITQGLSPEIKGFKERLKAALRKK